MDDNKFWLCVWSLIAASILTLVGMVLASCCHDDQLRADIVAKAADPMMAVCAYEANGSTTNSRVPYCTIYLSGRK